MSASSSWEPMPRPVAQREFLVEHARASIPFQYLPLILIGATVYAVLAWLAPMSSKSDGAVVLLTLLFILTTGVLFLSPNRDRLDLFRATTAFYFLAFCIGILFEFEDSIYYVRRPHAELLLNASALALFAYVVMLAGYYLPLFSRIPAQIRARHEQMDPQRVAMLGLLLWCTGFLFFWIFFASAGGVAVILGGAGGLGRTDFSKGIGILWWPLLWMTPGGVLYFAARAVTRPTRKWVAAWPLVIEFFLLLMLQGRHRALGPLLMAMIVSHYLIRPVRIKRLVVYGSLAAVLSIGVAEFRSPAFRTDFVRNPAVFFEKLSSGFEDHARGLMVADIGRLYMTSVVIDQVPEVRPYDWGRSLTIFLNPLYRIVGLGHLQVEPIGKEGYRHSRPEQNFEFFDHSGFLPSIVGEMRWNFPWYVCTLPFLLYGVLMRVIYQRLLVQNGDFTSVAIYAVLGLYVAEMSFQTFAQNLFELANVAVPAILVSKLSRRRRVGTWDSSPMQDTLGRIPGR